MALIRPIPSTSGGSLDTTITLTGTAGSTLGTNFEVGSKYLVIVARSSSDVTVNTGATAEYHEHHSTYSATIFTATATTVTMSSDFILGYIYKLNDVSVIQ